MKYIDLVLILNGVALFICFYVIRMHLKNDSQIHTKQLVHVKNLFEIIRLTWYKKEDKFTKNYNLILIITLIILFLFVFQILFKIIKVFISIVR